MLASDMNSRSKPSSKSVGLHKTFLLSEPKWPIRKVRCGARWPLSSYDTGRDPGDKERRVCPFRELQVNSNGNSALNYFEAGHSWIHSQVYFF